MLTAHLVNLLRRATALALAIYWIALFVGTHMPIPESIGIQNKDKWIHFLAYAGLAGLATLTTGWRVGGSLRASHLILIVLGFSAFGAFDELTQPLVHREADWFDWFADVAGVIVGSAAGFGVLRLLRRRDVIVETNEEWETENAASGPLAQSLSAEDAQETRSA